jgi:type I restriction enzyme S subunit
VTERAVRRSWHLERLKWSTRGVITGIWGEEPNGTDDIPCVRVADFDRVKLRVTGPLPTIRAIAARERAPRVLRRGDLLLEKSGGGDNQPVGCVVSYDGDEEAVCSNFVGRMPPAPGMHSRYWAYVHACIYSTRQNIVAIKQTTGIQNLDVEAYLDIRVHYPSPEEQIAIAAFLDIETARIDSIIAAKQRVLCLLAEKRKALIATAVTRGLDPKMKLRDSGVPWLGEIPAHWPLKRMKYLFRLVADKAPADNDLELLSLYTDVGVKPRRELEERGNKASSTDEYWMVKAGDLVVNKLLAWMGAFGVSEYCGVTSPAYDILRPREDVASFFYHHLLRCGVAATEIRARSYGIMDMRLRLYFDRLGDMYVPFPPFVEQHAIIAQIARETARLDAVRAATERTIALLKERRSALIAAAVTGQLEVGTSA